MSPVPQPNRARDRLTSYHWRGDAIRSRGVSDVVISGTVDVPAPPARLMADWQREISLRLGLEPGDVEALPLARARMRWPWRRRRPHKGGTVCARLVSIGGAAPQPHGSACRSIAKRWAQFMHASHQGLAYFVSGSSCSSNAATFF